MNANELAFPCPASTWTEHEHGEEVTITQFAEQGMDLRTYIATQLMAGCRAHFDIGQRSSVMVAGLAVQDADALIAELNK